MFYYQSERIVGTLCVQLILQFYADSFEKHIHFGHGLKIACGLDYHCHFFCKLNLAIFQALFILKLIYRGYLVCTTRPTVLCTLF